MRQQITSINATGNSQPITTELYVSPFNVGFGVVVTGTGSYAVTYTVQHTFDNPQTTASPTWFNHPTVAAITASNSVANNQDGNYAFPVAAIRVQATVTNAGTATLTLIQAGVV